MFANNCWALKVNSQKSQLILMLGSEGFDTEGSTSPGPGLRRNVKVLFTENHSLAPASWGIVIFLTDPGTPRGMAQFWAKAVPVEVGDVGKYGVTPSAWRRNRELFELIAVPVI